MSWIGSEQNSAYVSPRGVGPVMQTTPAVTVPATVAGTSNWTSTVLASDGFKAMSVGVTSSQAGALIIQRYIDQAGTVAQGAATTVSLTGGVAAIANITDGVPFASFTIEITNTSGSTANITNFAALMNAS